METTLHLFTDRSDLMKPQVNKYKYLHNITKHFFIHESSFYLTLKLLIPENDCHILILLFSRNKR